MEIDIQEQDFVIADWSDTIYGDTPEDLPPKMPKPRGRPVQISCFVDADHARDLVTRHLHTGVLIYLNNAPIQWFSKKKKYS